MDFLESTRLRNLANNSSRDARFCHSFRARSFREVLATLEGLCETEEEGRNGADGEAEVPDRVVECRHWPRDASNARHRLSFNMPCML